VVVFLVRHSAVCHGPAGGPQHPGAGGGPAQGSTRLRTHNACAGPRPLAVMGRSWCWPRPVGGIGVWPSILFPFLWVAPLLIITALRSLRANLIPSGTEPQRLDRSCFCGSSRPHLRFFLGNVERPQSGHWKYSIPFVHQFEIFEIAPPGVCRYLPVGLECAVIAGLVEGILPA